jgi:glycosyltransferase involved in cell wall biosynthesis
MPTSTGTTLAQRAETVDPGVETSDPGERRQRLLTVSLIIPTLNEAESIAQVLPRVPDTVDEIVIVDANSNDNTLDVVAAVCPRAVRVTQHGRGKGDALIQGVRASHGDIIITMDADGSMAPEFIPELAALLIEGADFVKGSRVLRGGGSADFTLVRRLGNWALTVATNLLHGTRYTDITYGLNAYWRHVVDDLGELSSGFQFEIQAAIRAGRRGMHVAEAPCYEAARIGGKSKLHPFRDGFAILRSIVAEMRVSEATSLDEATECADEADIYMSRVMAGV